MVREVNARVLGPSGFWHLVLPVGVCSLECNNNNNNNGNGNENEWELNQLLFADDTDCGGGRL